MKRSHLNLHLNLTSVIVIIAVGVLLPVLLSSAAGIVALVFAKDAGGIVTGILVISFAATAAGCGLTAVVLTGRKARLARLQSDFVANVSHEFRTPLSAIRLYAQTLQSDKLKGDPEKAAQCIATILRETEWLDVMIDRILTWRASSRDRMPLDMNVATVTGAVEGAVEQFKSMIPPVEWSLTASIESRLKVKHDARALNGIVLNLLTNAHKYSGGDKQIRVIVHDDQSEVVIQVEDNGIGLSEKDACKIFEPFYRAEGEDVGSSGVGLGLAIVHYLVKRHEGTIAVKSSKGKGTIFTIRLPAEIETP